MAREKFCFWLNLDKEDEYILADHIFNLKQERSFVSSIRDGIRLIRDLRAGRLDVLFELFPWTQHELETRNSGGNSEANERIARLEQMLLQQSNGVIMQQGSGPKAIKASDFAVPIFEDRDKDLLVMKPAKSSGNSANNFLASAFSLTQ
jgi:hypothetical protein